MNWIFFGVLVFCAYLSIAAAASPIIHTNGVLQTEKSFNQILSDKLGKDGLNFLVMFFCVANFAIFLLSNTISRVFLSCLFGYYYYRNFKEMSNLKPAVASARQNENSDPDDSGDHASVVPVEKSSENKELKKQDTDYMLGIFRILVFYTQLSCTLAIVDFPFKWAKERISPLLPSLYGFIYMVVKIAAIVTVMVSFKSIVSIADPSNVLIKTHLGLFLCGHWILLIIDFVASWIFSKVTKE